MKRDGRPVAGLTAADFDLWDNGVLQNCAVDQSSARPINLVFSLDTSASTTGQRFEDLVSASRTVLAALEPGDKAALLTFNERVTARIPLTSDLSTLQASLGSIVPSGNTSLLDGVYAGLLATEAAIGPSLVIVYTDGADTTSWLRLREVRDAASRLDAVMVAVVAKGQYSWTDLQELALVDPWVVYRDGPGRLVQPLVSDLWRAAGLIGHDGQPGVVQRGRDLVWRSLQPTRPTASDPASSARRPRP